MFLPLLIIKDNLYACNNFVDTATPYSQDNKSSIEVAVLFQYPLTQTVSSWGLKLNSVIVASLEKPGTEQKCIENPSDLLQLFKKVSRSKYVSD